MPHKLFTAYPHHNRYRVLRDRTGSKLKLQHGEDCYALQTALFDVLHLPGDRESWCDGIIGPNSGRAIWHVQAFLGLTEDGKAGSQTNIALVRELLSRLESDGSLYFRVLYGQAEHESSLIPGNYSAQRPEGDYDAGVAQQNTSFTPPILGFDCPYSLKRLRDNLAAHYVKFSNRTLYLGDDHSERRHLQLAAGAWNAPAFANYFAGTKPSAKPSPTAAALFEEYCDDAVVYL